MKTLFLFVAVSALTLLTAPTVGHAQSVDETAIRPLLDNMQSAFDKRDIKAFGSQFVQS